jgi:lysyl-tRNA synthetase class 2
LETSWRPGASQQVLAARANVLADIRQFFARRGVLEVETPLLGAETLTDPQLEPMASGERWLQTSPEYAMKRLLASGSGPIFQICKAFRAGESGPRHNPEFTLLEWYRPGFDLAQLIGEVAELVCGILGREAWQSFSYGELFERYLQIDPHDASLAQLEALARDNMDVGFFSDRRDDWLDLLQSHLIEPQLAGQGLVFVTDYPASQAALARLREVEGRQVAERFELYVDGLELANGYRELNEVAEQRERFDRDRIILSDDGRPDRQIDERLMQALEQGLPDCSGVALGVDRLLMVLLGVGSLAEVLSFDWTRA